MTGMIKTLTSDAVALLREMVAIPSPSFDEKAVCDMLCVRMDGMGIVHERIGNNIIASHIPAPEKKVIMLCAHIDTVSPSPEYSFDPYRPDSRKAAETVGAASGLDVSEDEIVAGLGSNDDGASVVSMIAAYRYFAEKDINVVLVLTCEEERSGINGMTGLWGTKIGSGEDSDVDIHIDRAIIGEPTGMKAAISERGLLVIDATANGVSGHAARNEGVNALYIATDDIMKLRQHEFGRISPIMGKVNLNVTQIEAGTAHNVIPDTCTFVIDIRPTEQYTNEEILQELQAVCRSTLKARNLTNRSSATYEGSPLLKTAQALGIECFTSPTTSDWMRIGCDAIKMGPGQSSRSHRKDEFVFVKEIEEAIKTYIDFIGHEHTLE